MVMQNTLDFRIMHYLKILVRKHLLIPYGLNELKYKKIPKEKTPLNSLRGGGESEKSALTLSKQCISKKVAFSLKNIAILALHRYKMSTNRNTKPIDSV